MYGIVNKAVQDMVVSAGGEEMWTRVLYAAGFPELQLNNTTNYDDLVSLRLVGAASEVLDITVETLLFEFGRHWVRYTYREGWLNHFKLSGDTFLDCLKGLDEMHQRVKDAMPDASMPLFNLSEANDGWHLDYVSTRTGFTPMVSGVLKELSENYGEFWSIEHQLDTSEIKDYERFLLKRVVQPAAGDKQQAA